MTIPAGGAGLAACPQCGAAVRSGADWCTLCFADLRPVPQPRSADAPVAGSEQGTPATRATLTCSTCGAQMPPTADARPSCGASLFATLAGETVPVLTLPLVGDLSRFPRNTVLVLALFTSVIAAGLIVGLVALLDRVL